ncbi:RimK family alpha-L-glutamate ligase [Pleionea sp. CnH1-48]|uniref:ATP-grasp domain-containing protein n=1 Tax=Pleionea sp. CnH1-48 TaxID=2954494 RepID=UPI002097AE5E|nr:hypothetical protein [Pleionea sp. CnH1-48]MCO7227240.1 hypothetical protein [Pleionea sp. CnH1-48]
MQYDVVILTEDRYESPETLDWYNLQILLEDEMLKDALESQGLKVARKSWSNADFDWSSTQAAIFRTTWDYFERFDEFKPWLEATSKTVKFINAGDTIFWNMDKHYLLDLIERGVNTVDTHILKRNQEADLAQLMNEKSWTEAILKPTISGAARHTYRISSNNVSSIQQQFDELIRAEDFMLQPFQENICEQGELSLMVMGGRYTHAVQKIAKAGDFRVQDDHGGMVYPYSPTSEEIEFAEKAIAACDPKPLYGRVDMVRDNNNELAIMELELIEPELFFRFHRPATFELAKAIKAQYFS